MIKDVFKKLEQKTDLHKLFSLNLNYNYSNCERIYLDEIWENAEKDSMIFRWNTIKNIISKRFPVDNNQMYICLVNYSNSKNEKDVFDKKEIRRLKTQGIYIPNDKFFFAIYDKDDEWYCGRIFYKENTSKIKKYIKGILRRNMKKRSFGSDVFFIDLELSTVFNLYDDRGIDFVTL